MTARWNIRSPPTRQVQAVVTGITSFSASVRRESNHAHAHAAFLVTPGKAPAYALAAARVMIAWLALLLAGLLEVVWALTLKLSDGLTRFWPTLAMLLAIVSSFALLGYSLKSVPFGTAYALWTGIGAAGSMIAGMLVFGESADAFRIGCLTLIIAGMVGLKLAS
jgi:quaternary ammonium compound-resistance protein SugE